MLFCRELDYDVFYACLVLIFWGQICICAIPFAFCISGWKLLKGGIFWILFDGPVQSEALPQDVSKCDCLQMRAKNKIDKGRGQKKMTLLVVFYYLGGGEGGGEAEMWKTTRLFYKLSFCLSVPVWFWTPKTCFTLGLECFGHIYSYQKFFWEIDSMNAKISFTLGPIEKFICFVQLWWFTFSINWLFKGPGGPSKKS